VSSLAVHSHGAALQNPLPSRPHTASSTRDESVDPGAASPLGDVPAMRIDTGASSAMELRTYAHSPMEAPEGAEPQGPRRRSRSVALLPSSGPKRRYVPPTPSWQLDLRPMDPQMSASAARSGSTRPFSQASDWTVGSESIVSRAPSSPGRSSEGTSGIMGLSPTSAIRSTFVGLPDEERSASALQQDSGYITSVPSHQFASQEELDEQQKQALKVFARTPEGKMWKAEQARKKHKEYLQKRTEWASNSVLSELSGGKFSTSKPKTEIDWVVHFAKQLPGPGAHNPKLPPREGRKDIAKAGTKFGTASRFGPDTIDHEIPGCGAYSPKTSTSSKKGGKFNGSNKVTAMAMNLRQIAGLPGPGEYDNYDREHRDVHLTRLAGKFSETTRMGRDLAMAEAAKVHSAIFSRTRPSAMRACMRAHAHTRTCDHAQKLQCAQVCAGTHRCAIPPPVTQVPGAGAYTPKGTRFEQVKRIKGGKILETDGQTFIDQAAKRATDIPGPLDTAFEIPRDRSGGRFSTSNVPSNVDLLCRESKKIPGPGSYKVKAGHKRRFTSFSKSAPITIIDKLAIDSGKIPGPGAYGEGGVPEKLARHVAGVNLNVSKPTTDLERQMKAAGAIPGPGQYGAPMQVSSPPPFQRVIACQRGFEALST